MFFQESILGVFRASVLPTSLHRSMLELPKMVYICQDANILKKLQGLIFVHISLLLSVEIVSANFSQLQR